HSFAENRLLHQREIIGRHHRLRLRAAKHEHVLAPLLLLWIFAQLALEDFRMRRIDDHEPLDNFRTRHRRRPGDDSAPVVTDKETFRRMKMMRSGQVLDESAHIADELANVIFLYGRWF